MRYAYCVAMLFALAMFSDAALAKASPEEAARLKTDLTPLGGEKAGNADGSIPAWSGGLTTPPAGFGGAGSRYIDAFPDDKPLYVITKANVAQYKDKLSAGHLAMFAKYADYKMPVYQSRRTTAAPQFIYDATFANATSAELGGGGEALVNAVTGIPFPIPKSGKEPIWNHKVRYRGLGGERYNVQAAVLANGEFTPVVLHEDARFHYSHPNIKPADLNNVIIYFFQETLSPPRLAGVITLVHETMDQVAEPRRAWQYNPGQRRLRRAPNIAYDNPGTASDGLRFNDQLDVFNGAMDRYDWKIIGKREMLIPYNAYRFHSDKLKYKDIVKQGHLNQDYARYEMHRVWVVEANQRPGITHKYKKRVNYLDEDSWTMVMADLYDERGQLWRFHEGHPLPAYDKPFMALGMENVYDLLGNRYIALGMNNEHPEGVEKDFPVSKFDPGNVVKQATK